MPYDPTTKDILHHATLTSAVNEIRDPNNLIKNEVFGADRPVNTRTVEVSIKKRGRKMAPLVKRDGAAVMTEGRTDEFFVLTPAHVRIKRPMSPTELLEERRAGRTIFIDSGAQQQAIQEYMADELSMQMDDHTNTEEFLACQALRGGYTYDQGDGVNISVDFRRSASHTVTLTGTDLWDDAASNPQLTILEIMELINDDSGLVVTDMYMGSNASDAFVANDEVQRYLETRRLVTGSVDLTQQVQQNGAIFLGAPFHGVNAWRYSRKITLPDGTSFDLIRPDYVEFVCRTPQAEMVTYYGAIEDMKAIGEGRVLQSKRFSKSWEVEDPSARMLLTESNPLPVMRRPDTTASVKVV